MQWNEVTRITVRGSVLVCKDAMIMLSENETSPEWPCITCSPGEYIFEINVPTPFHAHRARIRRMDAEPERGAKLGAVDIDNAFLGVIDYDVFLAAVKRDFDDYEGWTADDLFDELDINFSGEIDFQDTKLLYVQSGDGDGSYDCHELVQDGEQVGIECIFIE